jgi:hypothetical protein
MEKSSNACIFLEENQEGTRVTVNNNPNYTVGSTNMLNVSMQDAIHRIATSLHARSSTSCCLPVASISKCM